MTRRTVVAIGSFIFGGFAIAVTQACSSSSSSAVVDSGACGPVLVDVDASDAEPGSPSCWTYFAEPCGLASDIQVPSQVDPGVCRFNFNDCPALCGSTAYIQCVAYGASCLGDGGVVPSSQNGGLVVACGTCVDSR